MWTQCERRRRRKEEEEERRRRRRNAVTRNRAYDLIARLALLENINQGRATAKPYSVKVFRSVFPACLSVCFLKLLLAIKLKLQLAKKKIMVTILCQAIILLGMSRYVCPISLPLPLFDFYCLPAASFLGLALALPESLILKIHLGFLQTIQFTSLFFSSLP